MDLWIIRYSLNNRKFHNHDRIVFANRFTAQERCDEIVLEQRRRCIYKVFKVFRYNPERDGQYSVLNMQPPVKEPEQFVPNVSRIKTVLLTEIPRRKLCQAKFAR